MLTPASGDKTLKLSFVVVVFAVFVIVVVVVVIIQCSTDKCSDLAPDDANVCFYMFLCFFIGSYVLSLCAHACLCMCLCVISNKILSKGRVICVKPLVNLIPSPHSKVFLVLRYKAKV